MGKIALALVLLAVGGHFSVRFVRTNPLAPVFEGGELVVETADHQVRFALDGPVEGTYLLVSAERRDWKQSPINVELVVRSWAKAPAPLDESARAPLEPLAETLSLVGASPLAYHDLRALLSSYEAREAAGGERVCVTLAGNALVVASAIHLETRRDAKPEVAGRLSDSRVLLIDRIESLDCGGLLRPH